MGDDTKPSVTLIGPGAIGAALAGALVDAGHQPTLVARTPFDRLRVEWPDGSVDVASNCISSPADLDHADVVIVATKAIHNASIAEHVRAALGPESVLLIAQNGVDHVDRFTALGVEPAAIVPAVVLLPAERPAPGHSVVSGAARLRVPAGTAAARIESLFEDTFVQVSVTDDWVSAAWQKLLMNAPSGAMSVLARRGPEIYADIEAQELLHALMQETLAVAQAEGAEIDPAMPEKLLTYFVGNAGGHTTSIALDRMADRPTEWRERNAIVVERARRHGIDVPLTQAFVTLMRLGEPDFEPLVEGD